MIAEKLLKGIFCKSCKRPLVRSYLSISLSGIEKDEAIVYPVFCICGGVNIIGGEIIERKIDREQKRQQASSMPRLIPRRKK